MRNTTKNGHIVTALVKICHLFFMATLSALNVLHTSNTIYQQVANKSKITTLRNQVRPYKAALKFGALYIEEQQVF